MGFASRINTWDNTHKEQGRIYLCITPPYYYHHHHDSSFTGFVNSLRGLLHATPSNTSRNSFTYSKRNKNNSNYKLFALKLTSKVLCTLYMYERKILKNNFFDFANLIKNRRITIVR